MKLRVFAPFVVAGFISGLLQAQDTVVGFDEPGVAGKLIQDDYFATKGVKFLAADLPKNGGGLVPFPGVMAAAGANSSPNVASISGFCTSGEFCTNGIVGQFKNSTTHIRIFTGSFGPASETAKVTLNGYNADQKLVATGSVNVTGGAGFHTALDISLSVFALTSDVMVYFTVGSAVNKHVAIDDLTFDAQTTAAPPDFAITWNSGGGLPVQLSRGGKNSTTIVVTRLGTSTGDIALVTGSAPAGVTVTSISPNPTKGPGPDGTEIVTVTLAADDTAIPGTGSVTITGKPMISTAGSASHSAVISVTVRDTFDVRVVGVEVTQSIQSIDLPQKNGIGVKVPYTGGTLNNGIDAAGVQCAEDIASPGRTLADHGVALAEGGKTIVRVFANLRIRSLSLALPPIEAALFVCDSAGNNCSAAIKPDGPPLTLVGRGPNKVCDLQRADPNAAYVFTLDNKYAKGTITLKAQVFPPTFFSSELTECSDPECVDNNTFVLSGVTFTKMNEIQLCPIELLVHCGFGADPKNCTGSQHPAFAFAQAVNVAPLAVGGLRVPDYQGSIEIGDIVDKSASDTDRASMVVSRLVDRADDWNAFETQQFVIGVYPDTFGGSVRGLEHEPGAGISPGGSPCDKNLYCAEKVAIVTGPPRPASPPPGPGRFTTTRPLTSGAHELSHMFGRNHAGQSCPGLSGSGAADSWPPDDKGYIQGFGLDRRNGFYSGLYSPPGPYRTIVAGRSGALPLFYDFMSYCARGGAQDPDSWISVRGWNETIADLHAPGAPGLANPPLESAAQPLAPPAAASGVPVLLVRAIVLTSGSVVITKVGPAIAAASNDPPFSNYHLVARGPSGAILSDTQMSAEEGHADPDVEVQFLSGRTTATSATSLEIQLNGNIAASRTRSATAPVVKIVAPVAGSTVGLSNNTLVQWTTSAPGAASPMAKVDYSVDNGQSWKPLYFGPDVGQATLPGSFFTTAACGKVRVRVNDGFNEGSAVSDCFTAIGSPPTVRILDPATGTSFPNNSTLVLTGEAYEETGKPVGDQQLRWLLGANSLGSGRSVSATGFAPGTTRIQLTATDLRGRSAAATLLLVCGDGQVNKTCTIQADNQVTGPQISNAGIGNAASYESGAVSPGEIVTIFGSGLGPPQLLGLAIHNNVVDSVLDDTAVLFDDKPAPLIYVLSNQVSAIVPYGVSKPFTQVQVVRKGVRSNIIALPVADSVPGIFTVSQSGAGQGAILNEDNITVNGPDHPAKPGSIVIIFATGEGQTSPAGVDGKLALGVYPKPLLPVTAIIGGQPVEPVYAGAAPTLVAGVLQVNVQIPAGTPSGNVSVQLRIGNAVSKVGPTVAVQ